MSAERSEHDYPVKDQFSSVWRKFVAPRWYLHYRLRLALQGIDRLERQLAGEFGLSETAPLIDELAALIAERDSLVKRLFDQG